MIKKLSGVNKTFLDNYLITNSVSKASKAAGYNYNNYKILSEPAAKSYLMDKRRKLNNAIGLDFW